MTFQDLLKKYKPENSSFIVPRKLHLNQKQERKPKEGTYSEYLKAYLMLILWLLLGFYVCGVGAFIDISLWLPQAYNMYVVAQDCIEHPTGTCYKFLHVPAGTLFAVTFIIYVGFSKAKINANSFCVLG